VVTSISPASGIRSMAPGTAVYCNRRAKVTEAMREGFPRLVVSEIPAGRFSPDESFAAPLNSQGQPTGSPTA